MPDTANQVLKPRSPFGSLLDWIKGHERSVLVAAVAFQVIVLVAMIGLRLTLLLTGETLLVRVVPVDPRDLFRGDYVVLGYEFSRVPPAGIDGLSGSYGQWKQEWLGRTVYVTLAPEPDGKHWRAERFSISQPAGGKYLSGRLVAPGRLEFGIESYYLQEGKGKGYEQAMRNRRLSAQIAVSGDGHAALRGLRIE
jgi:uncharacterized membrane-anchored protein